MKNYLLGLMLIGFSTMSFASNNIILLDSMKKTDYIKYEQRVKIAENSSQSTELKNGFYLANIENRISHQVSSIYVRGDLMVISVRDYQDAAHTVLNSERVVAGTYKVINSTIQFDTVNHGIEYLSPNKTLIAHFSDNKLEIEDLFSNDTTSFNHVAYNWVH
ncbi:hypothetical protein [Photobacterium damselae]|uniref:hypothetical protein n=1 Tax=Photobacterium damselae TaxID=38293 RepID=UPI00406898D9